MTLTDAPMTRLLVHLGARYPDGGVGWVVDYVVYGEPLDVLLNDHFFGALDEIIDQAINRYHREIGPAYSIDDFVFTIWPFESPEEMFWAAGERMLATDGRVDDFGRPGADSGR